MELSDSVMESNHSQEERTLLLHARSHSSGLICLRSKATLLILLSNFLASIGFSYNIGNPYVIIVALAKIPFFYFLVYGVIAAVLIFFPLGGIIGDIKCGRYKIIKMSLVILLSFHYFTSSLAAFK